LTKSEWLKAFSRHDDPATDWLRVDNTMLRATAILHRWQPIDDSSLSGVLCSALNRKDWTLSIEAMTARPNTALSSTLPGLGYVLRQHGEWYSVWRDVEPFTADDCIKDNMTLDDVVVFVNEHRSWMRHDDAWTAGNRW
jgi:hypothetical protein